MKTEHIRVTTQRLLHHRAVSLTSQQLRHDPTWPLHRRNTAQCHQSPTPKPLNKHSKIPPLRPPSSHSCFWWRFAGRRVCRVSCNFRHLTRMSSSAVAGTNCSFLLPFNSLWIHSLMTSRRQIIRTMTSRKVWTLHESRLKHSVSTLQSMPTSKLWFF